MEAGNRADRPRRRDLSDHGVDHPAARRHWPPVTTGLGEVERAVRRDHEHAGSIDFGAVGGTAVTGQPGHAGPGDDPEPSRWRPFEDLVATAITDVEVAVAKTAKENGSSGVTLPAWVAPVRAALACELPGEGGEEDRPNNGRCRH